MGRICKKEGFKPGMGGGKLIIISMTVSCIIPIVAKDLLSASALSLSVTNILTVCYHQQELQFLLCMTVFCY